MLTVLAEFAGAALGVFWAWLILMPTKIEGSETSIPADWIVPLCPVGVAADGTVEKPCDKNNDRDRAAFFS